MYVYLAWQDQGENYIIDLALPAEVQSKAQMINIVRAENARGRVCFLVLSMWRAPTTKRPPPPLSSGNI